MSAKPPLPFAGMIIPGNFPHALDCAVALYKTLGLPVFPCYGPAEGRSAERGKRPRFSRWKNWKCEDVTQEIIRDYFSNQHKNSNIGCLVQAPRVIVDLDSKPDEGKSVADWLLTQSSLAAVPRERTGGGAHLWFICRDLPNFEDSRGNPYRRNLVSQITPSVTAELIFSGNAIVSPSVHHSGHVYHWEVTGNVPEVSWAHLQKVFGFKAPHSTVAKTPAAKGKKEKSWWTVYKGDLRTLDVVALAKEVGIYGELLNADKRTHSVRCPWAAEHSDGGRHWTSRDGDSVVFANECGNFPAFKCLHAHCSERGLMELLWWSQSQVPGIVDKHCRAMRGWTPGQRSEDGKRARVLLPGAGRNASSFAFEVGQALAGKFALFNFADNLVQIREASGKTAASAGLRIHMLDAKEAITEVERYVEVGVLRDEDGDDPKFVALSMSEAQSRILLASSHLREKLPPLRRILDVSVPIIVDGKILYPNRGYDARFSTFLASDTPETVPMSLDEARGIFQELLGDKDSGGFCWADEQSKCHAVARILTPFCRGLMGWSRPPLWIIEANRERCGKDFLAQIPCLLYLNRKIVYPPPSKDSDEEMRKLLTSALMGNARMIHFANIKGHIRYASLEAATDNTGVWQDRILGGNKEASLPNEAEFSFSANAGTTWEPDIEGRSRRIRLHYDHEEINARTFKHSDLHAWVLQNRSRLLSACSAFVGEWDRLGRPNGPTPFASFPQWASIVGGVMHACSLGDPCRPHSDASKITGDQHTEAMKMLFAIAFKAFGTRDVRKPEIYTLIHENQDDGLLEWIDLTSRPGQTAVGKMLAKYNGRELGGIRMSMPSAGKNNLLYKFTAVESNSHPYPEGTWEHQGTFSPPICSDKNEKLALAPIANANSEKGTVYYKELEVPAGSQVPSVIVSQLELGRIAQEIANTDSLLALDIETYNQTKNAGALSPFTKGAEIRFLTLAFPDRTPWIIDLMAVGYDLGELGGAIESRTLIGHNIKFDLLWLKVKCELSPKNVFCTKTASRLLTAGTFAPNDLGVVIERHLGVKLPKDQGRSDWGGMLITDEQLRYVVDDVRYLHQLYKELRSQIAKAKMAVVAFIEMELIPVVVAMEAAGFPVNRETFLKIANDAERQMSVYTEELRRALSDVTLNPNSIPQLQGAFSKLGISLESTNAEAIAETNHEAIPLLLAYRHNKMTAQQAKTMAKAADCNGRIHGLFEPTGTITGRFSSSQPNLQQIQRGVMRSAFQAPEGMALVVADYSQIELRGVALIAPDELMLEALNRGEDLHRKTAALVLGKDLNEITKEERQKAKAVNFGLIYGQYPPGLVTYARTKYNVILTLEEATAIRARFFNVYKGLADWHKKAWFLAKLNAGKVSSSRTHLGRRRIIPSDVHDWSRFSSFVNTPVQGTCGDGMKAAMLSLGSMLPPESQMIATVHDELVVLTPASDAQAIMGMVVKEMKTAMEDILPGVPIDVDARVCSNWSEK